jgi:hypothetical protein
MSTTASPRRLAAQGLDPRDDYDEWRRVLRVNLDGVFFTSAPPQSMVERGGRLAGRHGQHRAIEALPVPATTAPARAALPLVRASLSNSPLQDHGQSDPAGLIESR